MSQKCLIHKINLFSLFKLKKHAKRPAFCHQPAVITNIFHLQSKKEPGKMNVTFMHIIFERT
jgi:hypothetical protein